MGAQEDFEPDDREAFEQAARDCGHTSGIICSITWDRDDIADLLDERGIIPTDEIIDRAVSMVGHWLQDRSIELGWGILQDLIDFRELEDLAEASLGPLPRKADDDLER